jgi:hypothetical protein
MTSRAGNPPSAKTVAVQLLRLPPAVHPKLGLVSADLRRLNAAVAVTVTTPVFDSTSVPAPSASGSASMGKGSGVDWAAEARRALRAYEIRHDQLPLHKSVSTRPEDEHWAPNGQHRAGEQFKTPNGDWMVWINADCYQVAGAGTLSQPLAAAQLDIFCRDAQDSGTR